MLEKIVVFLHGDPEVFRALWADAVAPASHLGDALHVSIGSAGAVSSGYLGRSSAVATRTLPADLAAFTGRGEALRRVVQALSDQEHASRAVVVTAVDGMAGVGKTALAVHAAHTLADRFPDGQFFVRLEGYTPGRPPVEPTDVLATLLQSIGVSPQQIPVTTEARAALWRDRIADRKILLVLDDAAGSEQVRPLLPGTAGAGVLVTSRHRLTALEQAQSVPLDVMPPDEAEYLFVRLAGRPDISPGLEMVSQVVALCGYLPLAISLAAGQLRHHPAWTVSDLVSDLSSAVNRLARFTAEDVSVAASFGLSYHALSVEAQRMFRRLGLHPGIDIDVYAAASLDNTNPAVARQLLDELFNHHLVSEPSRGRYHLHDLLREYARVVAAEDPPAESRAAVERLLGYYLTGAQTADRQLARHVPVIAEASSASDNDPLARERSITWLQAERANLHAAADYAAQNDQPRLAVAVPAAMHAFLRTQGHWDEALILHRQAVEVSVRVGNKLAEAEALTNLGDIQNLAGDYSAATASLQRALNLSRETGNQQGQANSLYHLATMRRLTGDYRGAADGLEQALAIYRDLGDRLGQANALVGLGTMRRLTGDYRGAADGLEQALATYRDLGDRLGQADALSSLGTMRQQGGDYRGAADGLEQALAIYRDLGDRLGQANALLYLGTMRRLTGDYRGAADGLEQALAIYRDLGDRLGQANALLYLGEVRRLTGDYRGAVDCLEQAQAIHRDLGSRLGQANALLGLGTLRRLTGDYSSAADGLEQALAIYRGLGDWIGQANALLYLGDVRRLTGDYLSAARVLDQALNTFRDLGDRSGEVEALNERGTLHRVSGDLAQAQEYHQQALGVARTIASSWDEAQALVGLGRCAAADGHTTQAGTLMWQAQEIFQRIGAADAPSVRAELDALTSQDPQGQP